MFSKKINRLNHLGIGGNKLRLEGLNLLFLTARAFIENFDTPFSLFVLRFLLVREGVEGGTIALGAMEPHGLAGLAGLTFLDGKSGGDGDGHENLLFFWRNDTYAGADHETTWTLHYTLFKHFCQ